MNRRQFLQIGIGLPVTRYVDSVILKMERWADMQTEKLRASAYYRKSTDALDYAPEKDDYQGWSRKMYITFKGGSQSWFYVDPYDHYLLGVEGSGLLNLSKITGREDHYIPLCISGTNKWFCHANAQWGRGCKSNPLVPHRDFANSHWQFGTRITWGVPRQWLTTFRPVMYCADVFGVHNDNADPDRVDLFSGHEIDFGLPHIRAEVTTPCNAVKDVSISKSPVKGFQQCANILKVPGENGDPLKEDGAFGTQSNFALQAILGKWRHKFAWGVPEHKEPNDPEIYFIVREIAKENG